ncbi:PiggyBac transposable element-derived protein 4 [Elysia marginata]|uniref:PiggyBac transposable element-derived protein 4 n=1 Tax=Elysia marginata TaxID=1093978 RepID=A0AAV4ED59_9GAST|nr:PiggyBac transposable element-derived protein 4 [Elysia marginata]
MLDTSAIAASVEFRMKHPGNSLSSTKRRAEFMRRVGKDLMMFQMQRRFQGLIKASRPLRDIMRACLVDMGLPIEEGPARDAEAKKRGRCGLCHWKANKKGTTKCHKRCNFSCKDHVAKTVVLCNNCDALS